MSEQSSHEPDERISIFRMKLDTQHIMTNVEDEKNMVYKGLLVSESAKSILGNQCRKRLEQPNTPTKGVSGCSKRFPTDYKSVKIPEMIGPNITSQADMFEECLQKIEKNEQIKKKIVYDANIIGYTFSEASDKVQPVILFPHEIDGKIIGYTTGYNPNLCNVIVKHNKITKIIGSEPEIESESSYGYFYSDSDEDQW